MMIDPLPNPFESAAVLPAAGSPVAVATAPLSGAAAGLQIPEGYVLVRIELLKGLHDELIKIKGREALRERLPAFLSAPRPEYLRATKRGGA